MKRKLTTWIVLISFALSGVPAWARGGGGGRGGGGFHGGGGGARMGGGGMHGGGMGHSPSMSRPAARPGGSGAGLSRPSFNPGSRPGGGGGGISRPGGIGGGGTQIAGRPGGGGAGISRPGGGGGGISRPGGGPGIGDRPNLGGGGAGISRPGGGGKGPSIGDRPGIGDRPDIGRPGGKGPGQINRPGAGGGGEQRPGGGGNRPGGGGDNRPGGGGDRPNRPDNRPDNRPNRPDNRPDWANNNWNHNGNWNNNNWNHNTYNNWGHNYINHGDWHHGNWHDNWNHGWYNRPSGWWWGGFAAGAVVASVPWGWGYYSYTNPYATAPVVVNNTTVDYAQPLATYAPPVDQQVAAQQPVDQPAPGDPPPADAPATPADLANQSFDAARAAFQQNDYTTALNDVNDAIAKVPGDATLHEFRSLVLFAEGKYRDAAAGIYAVLSAGPGWDWTTLSGLYPDTATYTRQLRALEQYRKAHPDEADARFLLAYHYLTCGQSEAAATELKQVVRINPQDQLAAQLLSGLEAPAGQSPDSPAPAATPTPTTPAAPVNATQLVGSWKAAQPDGTAISLALGKDSKYTWNVTKGDQKHDFTGNYTVADNLLILNQDNNPAMVGQVTAASGDGFNFRLPGAPPSDPGLKFTR